MPIVTRDRKILTRTGEVNAVIASRARMLAITYAEPQSLWDQVRVIAAQWAHMLSRGLEEGPVIYGITMSGTRRLYPTAE